MTRRGDQLKMLVERWPIPGARDMVRRACERLLEAEPAARAADEVEILVAEYRECVSGELPGSAPRLLRTAQDGLARKAHQLAKKALRQFQRTRHSSAEYDKSIDTLVSILAKLDATKHPLTSRYVSPLMRFGILDQTVRMATLRHRRGCREPLCVRKLKGNLCRCQIWPAGLPGLVDPFAEFAVPMPPKLRDLDPRKYRPAAAVGLLRLYVDRLDPDRPLWAAKKGAPEPPHDQILVDELCLLYERARAGSARYDIKRFRQWFTEVVAAYGLSFLDSDNRVKRFESFKLDQRKKFGTVFFPRYVDPPPLPSRRKQLVVSKRLLEREKLLRSQSARRQLEFSLFLGGT